MSNASINPNYFSKRDELNKYAVCEVCRSRFDKNLIRMIDGKITCPNCVEEKKDNG